MAGPSGSPARGLPLERAAVMAVLDPSGGLADVDRAVAEGADLVGIRAGAEALRAAEPGRVAPFVAAVRDRHPGLLISVATTRLEVASRALDAGADILDAAGAGADPALANLADLAGLAAECGCGLVCTGAGFRSGHSDALGEVLDDLAARAEKLVEAGVRRDGVLVDPGGPAPHSLELLRRCEELVATGWPVVLELSDEDLGGDGVDAAEERMAGTLAATAVAALAGVRVFRTSEVRRTRRAVEMVASIAGTRPPANAVRGLASESGGR